MRACPDCGKAEDRRKDESGRELVNLDPVSGKCVECLVASVKRAALRWMPEVEYDWAKRAAGDDDE